MLILGILIGVVLATVGIRVLAKKLHKDEYDYVENSYL